MKTSHSRKWYRPREIAEQGLILNSKGKPDYPYILKLIRTGRLRAKDYSIGKKMNYWLVPEDEIQRYHDTISKVELT